MNRSLKIVVGEDERDTREYLQQLLTRLGHQPVAAATSVRVRSGKPVTTDGPFAETKEQLGGFYVLECKDLDEAIGWAAKIPNARNGTIEIRPVWDWKEAE